MIWSANASAARGCRPRAIINSWVADQQAPAVDDVGQRAARDPEQEEREEARRLDRRHERRRRAEVAHDPCRADALHQRADVGHHLGDEQGAEHGMAQRRPRRHPCGRRRGVRHGAHRSRPGRGWCSDPQFCEDLCPLSEHKCVQNLCGLVTSEEIVRSASTPRERHPCRGSCASTGRTRPRTVRAGTPRRGARRWAPCRR